MALVAVTAIGCGSETRSGGDEAERPRADDRGRDRPTDRETDRAAAPEAPAEPRPEARGPLGPPEQVEDYQVRPVPDGGRVTGTLRFEGTPPPARQMSITKDQEVCGRGARAVGEVVLGPGGALRGAVAYLERVEAGKAWPPQPTEVVQESCRFLPSSLVMRRNAELSIENRDAVFHNVHAYEQAEGTNVTMFNDAQIPGLKLLRPLKMRRGNGVKLECDAHNFMHQWFLVLDHPYFAETDQDGRFTINEVPPGRHFVRAWHPVLGEQRSSIEVVAGGEARADFTLRGAGP
jgi:hypothetical protein